MSATKWEVYRQALEQYDPDDNDAPPVGNEWEPFSAVVCGAGYMVFWRREVEV